MAIYLDPTTGQVYTATSPKNKKDVLQPTSPTLASKAADAIKPGAIAAALPGGYLPGFPSTTGTPLTEAEIRKNIQAAQAAVAVPATAEAPKPGTQYPTPAGPPAPTAPKTPAPAGAANYANFALEADGKTVYNVTTGKRYSSEAELAKDLGVAVGQIDWTKIKPSGAGAPATLTSGQYTTPSGAVVDLATGQIITPAPKSEGTSASFLAPPDTTATPTPEEQFFQETIKGYQESQKITDTILAQQHDQNISNIQRETGYNRELLTDAYNKSRRDIDKAFEMLGIGSVLSSQKLNDLALSSSDLTNNYLRELTKLGADEQSALNSGDTNYAAALANEQKNYFDFVVGIFQQQLNWTEKQQNNAMSQISELVSSGGISSLSNESLANLASRSGYSIQDLSAMRSAVATNNEIKIQTALQNLELKMAEFDLKQQSAESLMGYREAQVGLREESLNIQAERLALAAETTAATGKYATRLKEEVNNLYNGRYGTEAGTREQVVAMLQSEFPGQDVSKDIYNMVPNGWEQQVKPGRSLLTTSMLDKMAAVGIPNDTSLWLAESFSQTGNTDDIVASLKAGGMSDADARNLVDKYQEVIIGTSYIAPLGG